MKKEFNCSRSTIFAARKRRIVSEDLAKETGNIEFGQCNSRKPGNQPLKSDTKKLIIDFYESEENSKQLSGMKDFKSIKRADGTRVRVKKKLILCNLHELYINFKAKYNAEANFLNSLV